jgi:hypothetical protein
LQLGPKPQMTVGHLAMNFRSMILTNNIPEQISRHDFIKAKNLLLRKIRDGELRLNGRYQPIPYEDPCPACKGSGEIYEFLYKKVKVPCTNPKCDNGVVGVCATCKGTGKFKKVDPEDSGLIYRLKCIKCRAGKELCRVCHGRGYRTRFVVGKILSGETCKKCRGVGFQLPDYVNFFNSVGSKLVDAKLESDKKTLADAIEASSPDPTILPTIYSQSAIPVRQTTTEIDNEILVVMRKVI